MRFVLSRSIPALGAALLLSGCFMADFGDFGPSDRYRTDFHYSWDLAPDGRVNVEGFNGSIEISGWDENKVDIAGTKFASTEQMRDAVKIETHNSPSSVEVRAVKPSSRMGNMGVRFVIRVPRQAQLDRITTSNGSIRVRDVASAAHLKSSNGSIRVENVGGDLEARTSNSSIELDSIRGNASLKTSNGRIHAENITGSCDAETSNSSIKIHLDNAPSSPLRLITSNGSIELDLEKAPKNDIHAETRNSSITLRLPASTSATLTADTSNSSISSDFEVRTTSRGESRKNHLDGAIGSGGPRIDLSSSNGHIRIMKGSGN
ncbi:MAG: DUF4097 family beta strand repeat-containing protein [Acidobacteriota bacterium]